MAQTETQEAWFTIEFDGKAVGYEHIRIQPVPKSTQGVVSCFRKTKINLKRLGRDLSLSATLWTEQTARGELLSFDLERLDGEGVRLQRLGKFDSATKTMRIDDLRTGTRNSYDVQFKQMVQSPIISTWISGVVSPATQRSYHNVFFPESASVATIVSVYRASQIVRHAGQKREVSRQNFYPNGSPSKLTSLQITQDGAVIRQEKRVFGGVLAIVQSTADEALSANHSVNIDARALIPVDQIRNFASAGTHLALTITVSQGLLSDIPVAMDQQVERISDQQIRITLSQPTKPIRDVAAAYRQAPALPPTPWMPTHDRQLMQLATVAAGPEKSPQGICERMTTFVGSKMKRSAFSTTIVPANEVIRTFRGDCTEHAVLLATLLRIKGIPTRIAAGLVQVENQFGFQGHVWVEALVDNQWQPYDSTSPPETIRIKLTDAELSDSSASGIRLFLPVLELIGRTTITAEKTTPKSSLQSK